MRTQTVLLGGAAIGALIALSCGAPADAATNTRHKAAASSMQTQINELEAKVQFLTDRLDEQAAVSREALAQLQAAQETAAQAKAGADAAVATAKADDAKIETIPTQVKTAVAANKPAPSWTDATSVSGRMYYNMSDVEVKKDGVRQAPSGFGFDVKRFYIGVDHKFDNVYSANVTTDFTYNSAAGQSIVYIKKAYLQAHYSDALTLIAGAADMPWIPFMEDLYGNRYVEQTGVERPKYGTSSDWGLQATGKFGDKGMFNYKVAVVDGAGYKVPVRSKGVDVEGRFNVNIDKLTLAVGGYSGKLGKDNVVVAPAAPPTFHTATRLNAAAAWVDPMFRVGGEYFQAANWNNITTAASDKSQGYSIFGTYYFAPKFSLFANWQYVQPSLTIKPSTKDNYYNIGVSYSPAKIVDFALVYKHDRVDNGTIATANGTFGAAGAHNGMYDEVGVFSQLRW